MTRSEYFFSTLFASDLFADPSASSPLQELIHEERRTRSHDVRILFGRVGLLRPLVVWFLTQELLEHRRDYAPIVKSVLRNREALVGVEGKSRAVMDCDGLVQVVDVVVVEQVSLIGSLTRESEGAVMGAQVVGESLAVF